MVNLWPLHLPLQVLLSIFLEVDPVKAIEDRERDRGCLDQASSVLDLVVQHLDRAARCLLELVSIRYDLVPLLLPLGCLVDYRLIGEHGVQGSSVECQAVVSIELRPTREHRVLEVLSSVTVEAVVDAPGCWVGAFVCRPESLLVIELGVDQVRDFFPLDLQVEILGHLANLVDNQTGMIDSVLSHGLVDLGCLRILLGVLVAQLLVVHLVDLRVPSLEQLEQDLGMRALFQSWSDKLQVVDQCSLILGLGRPAAKRREAASGISFGR